MELRRVAIYLLSLCFQASAEDEFDVLSIQGVPFPQSSWYAAKLNVSFEKDIFEFTICYRHLIESYNQGWGELVNAFIPEGEDCYYLVTFIGMDTGFEVAGYQSMWIYLRRAYLECPFPAEFKGPIPRNIQTNKWYHFCFSYSSKQKKMHLYGNGLKIVSYEYEDMIKEPLPPNTFESMKLVQETFTFEIL